MNPIQIFLIAFLIFALSRVVLRFRDHHIKSGEFIFWTFLFLTAILVVAVPEETTRFARILGIGRGVDLIIYASIATLFYLTFRIYVQMEDIRYEITQLVRKIAIQQQKKKRK